MLLYIHDWDVVAAQTHAHGKHNNNIVAYLRFRGGVRVDYGPSRSFRVYLSIPAWRAVCNVMWCAHVHPGNERGKWFVTIIIIASDDFTIYVWHTHLVRERIADTGRATCSVPAIIAAL